MPTHPQNELEKMICDADLDYLGRNDYLEISGRLRREWEVIRQIIYSEEDWLGFQLNYLTTHKYYSQAAQKLRNAGKSLNIKKTEELLKKI